MRKYQGFKDLIVYQKAFELSIMIFHVTKNFPKEEKYSLTDQIRRAARAIGACIAEAWPKRRYEKAFVSKLTDAQSEACETIRWLDEAVTLNYMKKENHQELTDLTLEVQKMLESMIRNPEKFCRT